MQDVKVQHGKIEKGGLVKKEENEKETKTKERF